MPLLYRQAQAVGLDWGLRRDAPDLVVDFAIVYVWPVEGHTQWPKVNLIRVRPPATAMLAGFWKADRLCN